MVEIRKQRFNSLEYVKEGYAEYKQMMKRIRYLKSQLKDILLNDRITFLVKHVKTGFTIKVAVYSYNRAGKRDKRIRIIKASRWDLKNFKLNTQLNIETLNLISQIYDLQEQLKQLMIKNDIYTYRLGKRFKSQK